LQKGGRRGGYGRRVMGTLEKSLTKKTKGKVGFPGKRKDQLQYIGAGQWGPIINQQIAFLNRAIKERKTRCIVEGDTAVEVGSTKREH